MSHWKFLFSFHSYQNYKLGNNLLQFMGNKVAYKTINMFYGFILIECYHYTFLHVNHNIGKELHPTPYTQLNLIIYHYKCSNKT